MASNKTFAEFMEICEKFSMAADTSKPQSPKATQLPKSRERNVGKHDDWKDKPTEWGERPAAGKKLKSRASAVVGTQQRQDVETGVRKEENELDEVLMVTPTAKKPTKKVAKSVTKIEKPDPSDPDYVTKQRAYIKAKQNKVEEGIGMTMASALGNPPALSNRMKLKRVLLAREIEKETQKNKKRKFSGKAASETENK